MTYTSQEQTRLNQAFDFTRDELELNRNGGLSPRQQSIIATRLRYAKGGVWFGLIGIGGAGAAIVGSMVWTKFTNPAPHAAPPWWVILLMALMFGGSLVAIFVNSRNTVNRLNAGHIDVCFGLAATRKRRYKGHYVYYVDVAPMHFQVITASQCEAFQPGRMYRVFFVRYPPVHIILSAEVF